MGIATAAVAVLGVIYAVACWRGETLLRQEIERIAARGEPVWFADLAPRPDDPAIARGRIIAAAVKAFEKLPYELFDQAVVAPASPDLQAQVQPLVESHRPKVEETLQQLRDGDCRLEYDFNTSAPYGTLLPTEQNLMGVARMLDAEFHVCLAQGKTPRAVRAMFELVELDKVLRHEPFAMARFQRNAITNRFLNELQIALGRQMLLESELGSLDALLAELESRVRLAGVLHAERTMMLTSMENLGGGNMTNSLADDARGITRQKAMVLNHWWGSWLYRPRRLHQEAIMLRTMSRMAELIDVPGPRADEQFAEADAPMRDGELPLCEEFSYHLVRLRDAAMNHRQRLISARWALAVCRFRERQGSLPDSLADLTEAPPIDANGLITGQPLHYVKTEDGFVIYDGEPEQGRFEVHYAQ